MPRKNQHARCPDLLPTSVDDIKARIDALFPDQVGTTSTSSPIPPPAALALASSAIEATLERIRTDYQVRRYIGAGSRTFDLLTEAHASLHGLDLATVRNQYHPGSGNWCPIAPAKQS